MNMPEPVEDDGDRKATDEPLVSVIVRSMDRPTLAEALASLAAQTYPNIEVVVVNAKGGTHSPLPDFGSRVVVRLVDRGTAMGRSRAANAGLDASRGAYVAFLDDDDTLDAHHYSGLVHHLVTHPGARVAYAGVRVISPEGRVERIFDEPFDVRRLYRANFLPMHAPLIDRKLMADGSRFDETLEVYEDWDLWLSLVRRTPFHRVEQVSANYHLRGSSGLTDNQDPEISRAGRRAIYSKWCDIWTSDELEKAFALAEEQIGSLEGDFRHARREAELLGRQLSTAEARAQEAARREQEAQYHAQQIEHRAQQAEHRAQQAEHRAQQAEHRAHEAEHRAAEDAAARNAILNSTSWRITAPLRALRRGMRVIARRVFHALPLPPYWKAFLRQKFRRNASDQMPRRSLSAGVVPNDKEQVRVRAHQELLDFLASGKRIAIPRAEAPEISVVIVLYNQAGLTLECLKALATEILVRFETIIIDNASSDETSQLLDRVDGVQIARNPENLGFVRAVNQGGAIACAPHLLMLNNDAVVLPGTLAAALRRIQSDSAIGAVGGRIILYDGSLQEAGDIVWRDGSCLGYGRGANPDSPEHRFVREVDYCSGAFLLVRRDLFARLNGLDEAFAPAYYEETDFCFRLRASGYRVIFDPAVVVRHFEFASSQTSAHAFELQTRHREVFRQRHANVLMRHHEPSMRNVLAARSRLSAGARRVLFIDDRVPHPSLGSGFPRSREFVCTIVKAGHFVTFFPLQFPEDELNKVYETLPDTVEVMLHQGVAGLPPFLKARRGYYDVLVVSRPHNMSVVADIRKRHRQWFLGTTLIYDAEALFAMREILKAEILGTPFSPEDRQRLLSDELALAQQADHLAAVSAHEADHFTAFGAPAVSVLGHALTPRPTSRSFAERSGFLFVGALIADDTPNADSVVWFVENVWPHIVAKLGHDTRLRVVGPCDSPAVNRLAGPGVHILGRVERLDDLYDSSRVFIAPTRFAAGIPHKAHEAAAFGLPIVATPLVAQQLGWAAELLVGSDADAFATACIALHSDEHLWKTLRERALERVTQDCDQQQFARTVVEMMQIHVDARGNTEERLQHREVRDTMATP